MKTKPEKLVFPLHIRESVGFFIKLGFWALLVAGCGGEGESPWLLHLKLPSSLSSSHARYQVFLSRMRYAELQFQTKGGGTTSLNLPPGQWETPLPPELGFPGDEKAVLHINVTVWDKKRDGFPRTYPALTGRKRVSAKDYSRDRINTIIVSLTLQVSAKDY